MICGGSLAGGEKPAAVRLWIGNESGDGALKTKADAHDDHYHAHVEAPTTLADDIAMWVEVEDANGERSKASIPLDQ